MMAVKGVKQSDHQSTETDPSHVLSFRQTPSVSSHKQPVVFLDGAPVHWGDLRVALVEARGGEILAEELLDRLISRRLDHRGFSVTSELIVKEKDLLAVTLDDDPDQAQRLLDELRQHRGLKTNRFNKLLKRNAGLRLLGSRRGKCVGCGD